nr:nucleotidyltransferase family protein [Geodermatophilaceae bacterium]
AATAGPDVVAVGTYAGRRGHPVLIGRAHWATVRTRTVGDAGAREFLRAHPSVVAVPCEDVATPEDIDTPEDMAAAEVMDLPGDLPR